MYIRLSIDISCVLARLAILHVGDNRTGPAIAGMYNLTAADIHRYVVDRPAAAVVEYQVAGLQFALADRGAAAGLRTGIPGDRYAERFAIYGLCKSGTVGAVGQACPAAYIRRHAYPLLGICHQRVAAGVAYVAGRGGRSRGRSFFAALIAALRSLRGFLFGFLALGFFALGFL